MPVLQTAVILLLLGPSSQLVGQYGGNADKRTASAMWSLSGSTYLKTCLPKIQITSVNVIYIGLHKSMVIEKLLLLFDMDISLTTCSIRLPNFDSVGRQYDYRLRSRDKVDTMFLSGLAKTRKVLIHYNPESPDYEERVPTAKLRRS
jgi:hypothetical protein